MATEISALARDTVALLWSLLTKAPLTLGLVILVIIGYYWVRASLARRFKGKLDLPHHNCFKPVMMVLRVLELLFVICISVTLAQWIGLPVPGWEHGTMRATFTNEPTGFRTFRFGDSRAALLRAYPALQNQPVQHLDIFEYYTLEHQQFWDWNDVLIRFIYFKDRLYNVVVDYAPLSSSGSTNGTNINLDELMISRAKAFYGQPEEIKAPNGSILYIWRGRKGSVSLDVNNKSLALTDSELLIEYQAEVRKHGP